MGRKSFDMNGIGPNVQVGKGGPRVKNSSGVLELRNAADDGYAVGRGAPPINENDFVTLKYLQTRADIKVTGQIDGGAPPTAGTLGRIYIVTTTGGAYTVNELWYDNGSSWENISVAEGTTIHVTDALTGGTVEFSGDHIYIWDADNTEWDDIGPSAGTNSKTLEQRSVTISYTNTGDNSIGSAVPSNAKVLQTKIDVTQAFDGTAPEIKVGDSVDDDRLMTTAENDPESVDLYEAGNHYQYGSSTQLVVNLAGTSMTQGQATVTTVFANV
ncbi:MAG: hypothetical protein GY854_02365 [Deltaproteobacteria bacterium]|nr:hypothetical protein [Deltaproteobacteria bacterium]